MAGIPRTVIAERSSPAQAWREFRYRWLSVDGAIAAAAAALLLSLAADGQEPDMVLGTVDGDYTLVTPDAVVEAGGGSVLSDDAPLADGTASAGTADEASRDDHVHPATGGGGAALSDAKPQPLADPAAPGAGTKASRDDHAHPRTGLATAPQLATALQSIGANTADIQVNEQAVEHLGIVTSDLHAGTAPTGWSNASSASAGAVALLTAPPTLARARAVAAADWSVAQTSGVAGKEFVVRLPVATDAGEARLRIVGDEDGHALTFDQPVTGLSVLGDSTDGTFAFYGSPSSTGPDDTQLIVQLSGSAAHVGTSRFAGDPTKVQRWAIVGDPTAIPVRQVPDPAHHADGDVLTVGDGSYEWAAAQGAPLTLSLIRQITATGTASGLWPLLTDPVLVIVHGTDSQGTGDDTRSVLLPKAELDSGAGIEIQVGGRANQTINIVRAGASSDDVNVTRTQAVLTDLEFYSLHGGGGGDEGAFSFTALAASSANSSSTRRFSFDVRAQLAKGDLVFLGSVQGGRTRPLFLDRDPPTSASRTANCTGGSGEVTYFVAEGGGDWCFAADGAEVLRNGRYVSGRAYTLWRARVAAAGGGGGGGTPTPLSDGTPKALGTAAPGVGTAASRGDHVHPSELPARSSANALWTLRVNSAGNGLEWSNTLDRELTALTTRVTAMDNPRGPSAPKVGQSWQVVACTGSGDSETCQSGFRDQQDPPGFADGWVKLFEGQKSNVSGGAQIDFDLTDDATTALGFLEAQRDLAGMGPYRQFLFQIAWNIGEDASEELVQAQAVLPGVPLGGSVAQVRQGVRYIGALAGLDSTCPLVLKASTTAVVVEGNGTCGPDWGNRGSQGNVNLFWKLWGKR